MEMCVFRHPTGAGHGELAFLKCAIEIGGSQMAVSSELAPNRAGSRKPPAGRDRVRTELERTFEEVALARDP